MQVPKLVVFDVDGTLLDWDGNLSEPTRQALHDLRSADIAIALATGRPYALAERTLDQVGGADWMVCGNGSVLFNVTSGQMLRDRCLPSGVVEPTVNELRIRVPGVGFAIEVGDTVIEEPGFNARVPEEPASAAVPDALASYLASSTHEAESAGLARRLIVFHDDYDERLGELVETLAELVPATCQIQYGGLPIVDVSPAGDHKAKALQVLIEHLDISADDVVAFGDGGNDIEMLLWAGTGVAMGNARPEVQAAADHVTDSIDGRGIAAFLDLL